MDLHAAGNGQTLATDVDASHTSCSPTTPGVDPLTDPGDTLGRPHDQAKGSGAGPG